MKIFVIPTSYPDEKHPSKNIFVYEQVAQLAQMGHEITILHVEKLPTKQIFKTVAPQIKRIDNEFSVRYTIQQKTILEEHFPGLSKNAYVNNMLSLFEHAMNERGLPDVLYAHFTQWAGYSASIISQQYGIPLVTQEHYNRLVRKNVPSSLVKCVEYVVETSSYFLCVSERLKNSIHKLICTDKELYVVTNMIGQAFNYVPIRKHNGFIFSAIGRLTAPKDYETLINAFAKAFRTNENVYLRIGGDGEERSHLEKIVRKLQREHQIIFLGELNRQETLAEYINCDCFALSSAWETFGLVYREALAIGRPIITTDHGGFARSEWHEEYGYMVPVKDVKSFSNAMVNMRKNSVFFDGEKISELCLKDCAPEYIGRKIEKFLYKVVERI